MWRVFLLCSLAGLPALASEHWVRFTSGPMEVLSSAGTKDGRATLVKFEEYRHALGYVLGSDDLRLPVPVRVILFKSGAPEMPEPVVRGRERYDVLLTAGEPIPSPVFARLTELFLDANTARMPAPIEHGLVELFSTIQVSGIHITLGEPPAHPDLDWARMHLLAVDPQYYGTLRVLTYNLRQGVDQDAAFRNAFGKSPKQIEAEAVSHLAAGRFQVTSISPLPMSPEDFPERTVDPGAPQLAIADLLLGDSSRAAYRALIAHKTYVAEAWEGLGLLALRDKRTREARQDFAASIDNGAKSPACYTEYARLEPDNAKAMSALEKAVKLNPRLAEPYFLIAQHQPEMPKRIQYLKEACKLDPRNLTYWQTLAETYLQDHDYPQAEEAWRSAEQAANDPAGRARMEQKRLAVEAQRLDWQAAEKKREADENARELAKLKEQARAHLHELEKRANEGESPEPPSTKVVPWWNGPQPSGSVTGLLKRIDCLGRLHRLVVEGDGHRIVKLLISDPTQVVVIGGTGELDLSCGAQKPRRVKVSYYPKANARLATKGEVAGIEFQ